MAEAPKPWTPPTADSEFVFESVESLPGWADKSWAAYDNGPALAVPVNDITNTNQPYVTQFAHIGDTVKFTKKTMTFTIVPGEPTAKSETKYAAQQSNASLEDQIKTETISVGDLSDDAKSQLLTRSPGMKPLLEAGA